MGSALGRREAAERKARKAEEARKARLNSKFHCVFSVNTERSEQVGLGVSGSGAELSLPGKAAVFNTGAVSSLGPIRLQSGVVLRRPGILRAVKETAEHCCRTLYRATPHGCEAKSTDTANLKKFMEYVQQRSTEKLSKFLEKGLDPNFHDPDTGECPLTLASQLEGCAELIKVLKSGGAHLDFRTKDGITALHRAVRTKNHTALITLLDLGASPDYKDSRGLTPLYHSSMVGGDPYCCELLLHDHAQVGCVDENGWQEIHQACRHGHVQHLEHLLFYGADMSSQNASGNTALHVCALYNQDSCARVLLFRGANKEIKNYNSQTAFQVCTE
ncbi:SH3 and multiple ankyrin repeat domains protein 3 [Merluccius polli]|uniref:SH3 and multiple ankyrin repeat domains protein 3 n=1 Tax=Merluccius polli TaxID=89951 RepID=A0AA47MEM3_MERPO|nr:SH3 and multiple ankyrin repeat domains protein 3 [Merluccius polli]